MAIRERRTLRVSLNLGGNATAALNFIGNTLSFLVLLRRRNLLRKTRPHFSDDSAGGATPTIGFWSAPIPHCRQNNVFTFGLPFNSF